MAFLVRKINKRNKLSSLCDEANIEDIWADVPTNEFKTQEGALSTWIIPSLEKLEDAVLAIAVSSSNITRMDFIIIDTKLLDNNDLEYKSTYAGQEIAIHDLQDTHYDIFNFSLKKLTNCVRVYKTIFDGESEDEERYIIRFSEVEIKDLLKKAIDQNRVDVEKATGKIKQIILQFQAA